MQLAIQSLKNLEGFEKIPYADPITLAEPFTFGFGFTYIKKEEAEYILKKRILEMTTELTITFPWFEKLSELRQMVIINMRYQIGMPKFKKFVNTIKFISVRDYHSASIEMLDSAWYREMHELDMTNGIDGENRAEWLSWIMKHDKYREREVK